MEKTAMMAVFQRSSYDLAVMGGGPAGCAAAITAKRECPSASVLLLEKGSYPRHKVCGEFISPEALQLLKSLLGGDRLKGVPSVHRARLNIGNSVVEVPLRPSAVGLPRHELDARLWSAAHAAGVECAGQTAVRDVGASGPFLVRSSNGTIEARALINASGRWSSLARSQAPANGHNWIGLKAHFAEPSPAASVDLYFFRGGYCGVQPIGAEAINVCAAVRADVATDLQTVLAQHPMLDRRSHSWAPLTASIATAPLVHSHPRSSHGGVLLVGDAAGFIDPFLGDGISLALHSGAMAGEAAASFCKGTLSFEAALHQYESAYQQQLAPAFSRAALLRHLLTLPEILQWPLMKFAALPGIAEILFSNTRHTASASKA
jgi:menaquinone-9 beta-reductase